MPKTKSFTFQLVVIGGFVAFFYMFFTLATSIYQDFKLESEIEKFEQDINQLADMTQQKPEDVNYFSSIEYKDRYAKESFNLLNKGEKLIIIPQEDRIVEQGPVQLQIEKYDPQMILGKNKPQQWWEYFFGKTLSLKAREEKTAPAENTIVPEPVLDEVEGGDEAELQG